MSKSNKLNRRGHRSWIKPLTGKTDRLEAEIAELKQALINVRDDIASQSQCVLFRPNGITTFDYIGSVCGDPLSWDEWEAQKNPSTGE